MTNSPFPTNAPTPAPSTMDRRRFLKQAAALSAVGGVTMAGLRADPAAAVSCSGADGQRSLVCVFLAGGADSFNMFVPYDHPAGDRSWSTYAATRGEMAVPRTDLLPVGNGHYSFNSLLPAFRDLYEQNDLAVIGNVGPLVQPTVPTDVAQGRGLPESLFAHDAQQKLWQTAAATVGGNDFGWGGAISQQVAACDARAVVGPSFSAAGSNVWQNNASENYLRLNPSSPMRRLVGFDPSLRSWLPNSVGLAVGLDTILADTAQSPLEIERLLGESMRRTISTTEQLESVTLDNDANAVAMGGYGGNRLAGQLHLVARLIRAREELGMTRQVFFVRMGGWDTHGNQNGRLPVLMRGLNEALGQFTYAMGPSGLNIADTVTTFTASDFGRTLTSNGDGCDHGWGGHSFVMGGAVQGGQIYGAMPSLASTNNPDDTGRSASSARRWPRGWASTIAT